MLSMHKALFSLGDVVVESDDVAIAKQNVTIIVAYAHSVISALFAGRSQAASPRRSIVAVVPTDAQGASAALPLLRLSRIMKEGGNSNTRSSLAPSQPLPFSKVILLSWPTVARSLALVFSLDHSAYDEPPTGESYALFRFSNTSSGWLRVSRDRSITHCDALPRLRRVISCRTRANLSEPGAYALISQLDDQDQPLSAVKSDTFVHDGNQSAVVWGAVFSVLVCLTVVFLCLRRRYRDRFPRLFCAKLMTDSLQDPNPSAPTKLPICNPESSPPDKPLPPLPPDAFVQFQNPASAPMVPRPPSVPSSNSHAHRRRALSSLKPLPAVNAPPSLDSVIAILDEAQLRDVAAAAAPRPSVVKVTQGIRRKKIAELNAFPAKQVAEAPVAIVEAREHADEGLFIPSLEELGLASTQYLSSAESCVQLNSPAEEVHDMNEVIMAPASLLPSSPSPVLLQAPPPLPSSPVRMSPVLMQEVEQQLPELADGPSSCAGQAGGKLFSKKRKDKRGSRAKAPVPGMRTDEEEPEWMRAQKQQPASSCEIPSISSGCDGVAADADVEWAMIRKLQHQNNSEGPQELPEPSPHISVLPSLTESAPESAATARDSDLGGWTMVRKIAVHSPPLRPLPPPQQQQGLAELSDGANVLGARDVEGGFFVRRNARDARTQGVLDTSMDVEDFTE
jgi:hypothetical protein